MMNNRLEYRLIGRRALFTDPISKLGGEKFSYPIPTYQALKGITESIYWKPTIIWFVDRVRVVNKIDTETINTRWIKHDGNKKETQLSLYTYLPNVEYQVQVHFEWNETRCDLRCDQNENKHYFSAKRMLKRGGRRDIFLGTRECQGYVEECSFGEGEGFYDNSKDMHFGLMFHGFDYPDETGIDELRSRYWNPEMVNGTINFEKPQNCNIRRFIKNMKSNAISSTEEIYEGEML